MKKFKGLINRMVAVSLSGMLIIGSASGSVFASSTDAHPEQISEVVTEDVSSEEEVTETPMNAASEQDIQYYTVTLDANGGYFENEWDDVLGEYIERAEVISKYIPVGGTVNAIPVNEQEGIVSTFLGWSLEREGEIIWQEQEKYIPVDNCALYAVWEYKNAVNEINVSEDKSEKKDKSEYDTAEDHDMGVVDLEDSAFTDNDSNSSQDSDTAFEENTLDLSDYDGDEVIEEESSEERFASVSDAEVIESGWCGESLDGSASGNCSNVIWTLFSNGTVMINGTGNMSFGFEFPMIDGWPEIKKVVLEDGVCSVIGFANFESLEEVYLSESVVSIDREAFYGCTGLKEIKLPSRLESIDYYAFCKCSGLKEIVFPDSMQTIGSGAFSNCTSIQEIVIPDNILCLEDAFSDCTGLKKAVIKGSINRIQDTTFYNCTALETVILPETVSVIGEGAFYGCCNLSSINISDKITKIGDYSFYDCSRIKGTIDFKNVNSIGEQAFYNCAGLTDLVFYDSLNEIGKGSFQNCSGLTEITIPGSLKTIENSAFYGCNSLKKVNISEGVKTIRQYAFAACHNLEDLTIPNSIVQIDFNAFNNHNLKQLTISQYVVDNFRNIFENTNIINPLRYEDGTCDEGVKVLLSDNVTNIGDKSFYECFIIDINFSEGVNSIGDEAFYACTLNNLVLPNSLSSIGKEAFSSRSLERIIIPNSVSIIDESAFLFCYDLKEIYFGGSETEWLSFGISTIYNAKVHYAYEQGETTITLDPTYEGAPNKDLYISANVTSKKVAPESSNVTWTLTPLDGQEAEISWGSMAAETSGDNQYIISKPVTVSAVGEYNLAVSFNGASATAKVVIDSSLKARFPILRQNELKEYYTYYNGSEMKPGFTAEMEGENVSLDRLTYHYEENDKPGMAKLVIDTLDGNSVKSITEFLILPNLSDYVSIDSENAGEFILEISNIDIWKDFQIDIKDGNVSVENYPKTVEASNNSETSSFRMFAGGLNIQKEYIIKTRPIINIDGIAHGGSWDVQESITRGVSGSEKFSKTLHEVGQLDVCHLEFGLSQIKFKDKGGIHLYECNSDAEIFYHELKNDDINKTIEENGVIICTYGNGIIDITLNTHARALQYKNGDFEKKPGLSILRPDTDYYITIDPDFIYYYDVDESGKEVEHDSAFAGVKKGELIVKTLEFDLPTYQNPSGYRIEADYYNQLYGSNKGPIVQEFDQSEGGWCFGFCAVVASYYRGNPIINSIVKKVPLFTDVTLDTVNDRGNSFGDYIKYCQAYLHTRNIAAQRYNNKNKTDSLITAVKNNEYPVIFFSRMKKDDQTGKESMGGHAVTALKVLEDSSEKTSILVYNPSKIGNKFVDTLVITGNNEWEMGNYKSTDQDAFITYCLFDSSCEGDITDVNVIENNGYLIFAKANFHESNLDFLGFDRYNGLDSYLDDSGHYYWSESGIFSLEPEKTAVEDKEENLISIFGDNDKTTLVFPVSSGIEVNKPEGIFHILMDTNVRHSATLTYEYCGEGDEARKIEINTAAFGSIHIVTNENSITIGSEGEKELSVTATDKHGNTKTVDIPVTQNNINITTGGRLRVSEDTTEDGIYDTIVAEEYLVTDIADESFKVDKISDQTFTGKAITQTPTVKIGSTTLIPNTDYTVSYSNNINAGTATVTITGKGSYTGTKTVSFKINKADQSITAKATASSIAVGKTATVSTTGNKGKVTYTSSNAAIATVNASTGVVTGKKAGTVTITASAAATANYNSASKTVKITVTASKSLKKPGNCHFTKWNNSKYTSCRISWNKVDGAEGYETLLSWTNGSNASRTIVKSNVLYRDCTVHPQHVSQMMVRAFYMSGGKRVFGPWSNVEYITPSPTKLTTKNASSGSNLKMNISWNIIYGCNGYNVFLTTNPNGTWYWNQSTTTKADATSAVITKYRGSKLKKNTRYYVRIVTRRKRNGVFCTVPMPASNTYIGSFIIK